MTARSERSNEQVLIDIMFEVAMMIKTNDKLRKKSNEELAEWIIYQLKELGFITVPAGISLAVLIEIKRD